MLFGGFSPEGKLPVTFYRTTEELPEFTDYSMKGRTYRYMEKEALYPFGYGLSYTKFVCSAKMEIIGSDGTPEKEHLICADSTVRITAVLTNIGSYDGAETVQVYIKAKDVPNAPNYQFKGLKKLALAAGERRETEIILDMKAFGLFTEEGEKLILPGQYEIYVGTCQPDARSTELTGNKPQIFTVSCRERAVVETI